MTSLRNQFHALWSVLSQKRHCCNVAPKWLCNPFGSDVPDADALLSLGVNGPKGIAYSNTPFLKTILQILQILSNSFGKKSIVLEIKPV